MVFLYVKGQGETLFPLGREDPICKGGKKRMKKKALKRIVSLLLGALLLLGCTLPAGALTLDLEKTYTDVKRTDWFYNDVYWATITGTMSGTGAAFEPNAPMTRAMLVTTLYNRASPTELDFKSSRFQDVEADVWYTAPIEWAASRGIVEPQVEEAVTSLEVALYEEGWISPDALSEQVAGKSRNLGLDDPESARREA